MTSPSTQGASNIIQLLLPEQGRSQAERLSRALQQDYVSIEERDLNQLFDMLKRLSEQLQFYSDNPNTNHAKTNWSAFFPFELGQASQWLSQNKGKVEPHLALISVFLEQYIAGPVQQQNNIKQAYINFYYQHVLRFTQHAAKPEHAHVLLSLKKGAAPVVISPQDKLLAGKREDGSVIYAAPITDTIINHAQILQLRSVFAPSLSPAMLKVAPIANSSDGLGAKFEHGQEQWCAFGHAQLPATEIGFALSSSILQLAEGLRLINVNIMLTEPVSTQILSLNSVFKVFLSGEKGWTPSQFASASLNGKVLSLTIELAPNIPAIVPYLPKLHGFSLDTTEPVMQCVVDTYAENSALSDIYLAHIESISINVQVTGVSQSLSIESDIGQVNSGSAFLPFGSSPVKGSVLKLRSREVFGKRLQNVTANLTWKNPPSSLSSRYTGYDIYDTGKSYKTKPSSLNNRYFTASAQFTDAEGRHISRTAVALFNETDAKKMQPISISEQNKTNKPLANAANYVTLLSAYKSKWAEKQYADLTKVSSQYGLKTTSLPTSENALSKRVKQNDSGLELTLNTDFFHREYHKAYVKNVIAAASDLSIAMLSEPYTPELSGVSLDYAAYTRPVLFYSGSVQAFTNDELRFYHLDCFGQRREHAHQRQQLAFVSDKRVGLFAARQGSASLYIGLKGLTAGDSCQLFFQVVEGSADPSLMPAAITWSVLCDNYFQTLSNKALIYDTTNSLQTSGLVSLILPSEATSEHTLMPSELIWLRLSITGNSAAVCKLRTVHTNGIEVVGTLAFTPSDGEPLAPLTDKLLAGSISKFETSKPAINTVIQPYDGFDGAQAESTDNFSARVSARLRHKDRALSVWDYESMVLEQFPNIHRVKTVPHSQPGNWRSPGNVTILVVPYLDITSSAEPLRPKVSLHTIQQIKAFLQTRCAMQAVLHVINPTYVSIRMTLQVAFTAGASVNFYRVQLNNALLTFFSPWMQNPSAQTKGASSLASPQFGGRVYKSVVLNFIEELPYVDYVTNVVMQVSFDQIHWQNDSNEVKPLAPDQILSSAQNHVITQVTE
jgi:hypothetical protein